MAFLITDDSNVINSDKIVSLKVFNGYPTVTAKLEDGSKVNLAIASHPEDEKRLLQWIAALSCFNKAIKIKHLVHILKYSESFTSITERLDGLEINEALIDLINSEAVIKIPRELDASNLSGKFQKTEMF